MAIARRYDDLATIDDEALAQLASVMEDEFVDLLQTYLSNVPRELVRLDHGFASNESERVVASAHAIKGSSANLGAVRLGALCSDLERLARSGTLPADARQLRDDIHAEFARVKPALETRLRSLE